MKPVPYTPMQFAALFQVTAPVTGTGRAGKTDGRARTAVTIFDPVVHAVVVMV